MQARLVEAEMDRGSGGHLAGLRVAILVVCHGRLAVEHSGVGAWPLLVLLCHVATGTWQLCRDASLNLVYFFGRSGHADRLPDRIFAR